MKRSGKEMDKVEKKGKTLLLLVFFLFILVSFEEKILASDIH